MRVVAASILGVATAFRTNTFHAHVQKHETKAKWGATCEELHDSFSTRLSTIQAAVDALDPENPTMSTGEQISMTMRAYGLGRTMRRARECEWMQNAEGTDGDNAVKVSELVATLFRANPCGAAAQAALEEASSESEQDRAVAMQRAMSILTSDTCEATEVEDSSEEMEEMNDTERPVREDVMEGIEEEVNDKIEEMVSEETGSSFVETKYATERLLRFLVAIAIFIFLVVLCTAVVVWIGLFIIEYFALLLNMLHVRIWSLYVWRELILPPAMLACGYDLFFRILNPEIGRLHR